MNVGIEPMDDPLMQRSCLVALAAYLHDLGKFAEPAEARSHQHLRGNAP
jgi:hypothetical protein